MPESNAKPDRYVVSRNGTPDPGDSLYYVLDVVHDFEARIVLRKLVRAYRRHGLTVAGDELERFLNETNNAFMNVVMSKNPTKKKKAAKERMMS